MHFADTLPRASQTRCTPTFRMHNAGALSAPLPTPPLFLHIKNAVVLCLEADAAEPTMLWGLTADTPQPVSKLRGYL